VARVQSLELGWCWLGRAGLLGGDVAVIHKSFRECASKRSPKTVNQAMTAIQGLYEFHAAEGRIDDKQFVKLAHGWGKRGGLPAGNCQKRARAS
jgi:hypothetical protein